MNCPLSSGGGAVIAAEFNEASQPDVPRPRRARQRRPAPFSIRLTSAEKAQLQAQADGEPLGAFIKARLLDPSRPARRSPVDRQLIASVLSELGRSRLSSNLNQIAVHLNTGTIDVTPALIADFEQACGAIQDMRRTLITALGLKPQGDATNADVAGKTT